MPGSRSAPSAMRPVNAKAKVPKKSKTKREKEPRTARKAPDAGTAQPQPSSPSNAVEQAGQDSFPASDAPPWTP